MRSFLVKCRDEKDAWTEPVEADIALVDSTGLLIFYIMHPTKKLSTVFSKGVWTYFVEVFKNED